MPKRITPTHPAYVAPHLLGLYQDGRPKVLDERTGAYLDPHNLDNKIQIYEQQVSGWFLSPAQLLLESSNSRTCFVVLMVCLSYVEGVEQCRTGSSSQSQSLSFFERSFSRIFHGSSLDPADIKKVYQHARNGLFHDGMTRQDIMYDSEGKVAFRADHNGSHRIVYFAPSLCLKDVKNDFDSYLAELKDTANAEARSRFDSFFNIVST